MTTIAILSVVFLLLFLFWVWPEPEPPHSIGWNEDWYSSAPMIEDEDENDD